MSILFECFDNPPNRKKTNSYKWDYNNEKFGCENIIPLWIADMDFATPPVITEALNQRLKHPVLGYSYRTQEYVNSIKNWLLKRHDWQVEEKHFSYYPPGAVAAINMLVNVLTKAGDEVIVQTPAYSPLVNLVKKNNRVLIENPLVCADNEYAIDFNHLSEVISNKTKLLLFCSPHNPTGRVWREQELLSLAKICRENNIIVISDEVHADLIFNDFRHIHFNKIPQQKRPVSITIISPCKTFNIAATPQATIICDHVEINQLIEQNIEVAHLHSDGLFSAIATQAGYEQGDEWLNCLLKYLEKNRNIISSFIKENLPQVQLSKAQGTYLAWLDFSAIDIEHHLLLKLFIKKAKVGVYDGLMFGALGRKHFRINFACPSSILLDALKNIDVAINEYKH